MMEEVVDTVNNLQDVFSAINIPDIDLPQIVVVGTQSAGKSSVLEHIVGKSFLPRGSGIVTRCPLVLQLVNSPDMKEECAVFQHNPNKAFTDYDLICKEIEDQTDRLAGSNKGICHTTINLKIFSPIVLNLTLVDLPGLTKVAIADQPKDIEKQIRDLILQYINNPNSIILAVTPANVDMATSDSLKIAKEVDPQGTRTLAVLTKLDLMDKGTDALEMLHGNVIPVKLGIVGVVNRSQKDIQEGKSIEDSLKDEAEFLQTYYKSIAATHGSPYLTKTMQAILVSHIQTCMPELRERISQKLSAKKTDLSHYAKSNLDNPTLLLNLVFKYTKIYVSAIKGYIINIQTDDLFGGARIHSIFQDVFAKEIRGINPLAGLKKSDIVTAIKNANGMNPAIFVPEIAFERLAQKQVEQFRRPSLKCVELVHGELNKLAQTCLEDISLQLDHYPKLKSALGVEVTELLLARLPLTNQTVTNFIDIQVAHINKSHPDFLPKQTPSIKVDDKNISFPTQRQLCINLPSDPHLKDDDRNSVDYVLVKELIKSYISIVCKIVEDTIPKMIIQSLVNFLVDQLQVVLVKRVYDQGNADLLLCESKSTVTKRNNLEAEIQVLEKADKIINTLSITMIESKRVLKESKYNNGENNHKVEDDEDMSEETTKLRTMKTRVRRLQTGKVAHPGFNQREGPPPEKGARGSSPGKCLKIHTPEPFFFKGSLNSKP